MSGDFDTSSEFDRLVAQLVPHEPSAAAPLPPELVRNAALGALLLLAAAVLAALLVPTAEAIRGGGFFLVATDAAAAWAAGLKVAAGPLAALAVLLGALDAYLWQRQPTDEVWRYACVAQPWVGLVAVGGWLAFVVAVVVNLALWALIIAAVGAAVLLALAIVGMVEGA